MLVLLNAFRRSSSSILPNLRLQRLLAMSAPQYMRSVQYDEQGTLRIATDTPTPTAGPGQLLVKVSASGVNRLDVLQKTGKYPIPPGESTILGLEVSGTVVSVGEGTSAGGSTRQFQPGDRVCALVGGGGYAEYCVTPVETTLRLPEELSFVDGAAIPENYMTAYGGLYWSCDLGQHESALIHAAASGVGTAAIQMAKAISECKQIFATAGSQQKLELCRSLGATHTINYKESDFADAVLSVTENRGVDVIMDFVGATYWEKNLKSVALDGRMVVLGLLGGGMTKEGLDMGAILRKRVRLTGSTLRSRPLEYKSRLASEFESRAMPLFVNGQLKAVVDSTFSVENVEDAHKRMTANLNVGKIILTF